MIIRGDLTGGCRRLAAVIEQAVQKWERRRFSGIFLIRIAAGKLLRVFDGIHGLHHFVIQIVQVVVRDAHTLHHVIDLRQTKVLRTFQAQTLVDGLIALHPGNKNRGNILFTSGTKCRLHNYLRTALPNRRKMFRNRRIFYRSTAENKRSR